MSAGGLQRQGILATLRQAQLFMGVAAEDLEVIAGMAVLKTLEKGRYLFREGDRSDGFYVVQSGAVNVHRVSASGKQQVIHVFRAGETFAEASLAMETGYPADAVAQEATTVLLVPKADFLELLRRRPELALRMLASMSQHLRVLVGLVEDLTLKDVETRLANWFLKRCWGARGASPVELELGMSKKQLAAELGTTGETLSRTLAEFRRMKLVAVRGKTITLLNPARLAGLLRRNIAGC